MSAESAPYHALEEPSDELNPPERRRRHRREANCAPPGEGERPLWHTEASSSLSSRS